MKEELYQIGTLAERAQVSIQTIRYYERIKLLLPKSRKDSNKTRLYDDESLKILHFIKYAQELSFHLEEIKELLVLRCEATGNCEKVKMKAVEKLDSVKSKIEKFKGIEKSLKKFINECEDNKAKKCPIINKFENNPNKYL